MPNRNPGFEGTPCYDLCTEVAMMEHGHLPFTGGGPTNQPDDFEEPDLYADGDRNIELWDRAGVDGDIHGSNVEDAEDVLQNYLLEQLAEEQAIEAEEFAVKCMAARYAQDCDHPFYLYQYLYKHTTGQHAVETRSEALAVVAGRSVKKCEATDRKHQQFYGNLRIH